MKADKLVYVAIICAIIGIILLVAGPYLPIPAIIPFTLGSICFIIVIITSILALCTYQREFAQTRGREVF